MTRVTSTTTSPATGAQDAQRTALVARYQVMELIELAGLVEQSQEILTRHDTNGALLSDANDACGTMDHVHSDKAITILSHVMEQGVPADALEHYAQLVPPGKACGLMTVAAVGAGLLPDVDGSLVSRHVLNGRGKTALARGCFHIFNQRHAAVPTQVMTVERMSQWIGLPGVSSTCFSYNNNNTECKRLLKRDPWMVGSFFLSANLQSGVNYGAQLAHHGHIPATQVLDWTVTTIQHNTNTSDLFIRSPSCVVLTGIKRCLEIGPASAHAESHILAMCTAMLATSEAGPKERIICEQIIEICCDQRPASAPTPPKLANARRSP
jgi:hypothetical protein